MIFKKIRFRNFLSYGNYWTEIDLDSHHKTLIVGTNGSGKSSSVLDTLCFGLYGRTFRSIKKDQILNSITRKQLVVEVYFSEGGSEYKVVRGIKPNIFEIWQNDELLHQSGKSADYQELLETTILRKSFKTFTQIDILGSAKYVNFMELTTGQRREIIEDLLDLQIFTNMNVVTKAKILENKEEIQRLETEVRLNEIEYSKIDELLQVKSDIFDKQILDLNEKILTNKAKLIDLRVEEDKVKNHLDTFVIEDVKEYSEKKSQIKDAISQLKYKNRSLSEDIKFFENNDSCPTCKQKIDLVFKFETRTDKMSVIVKNEEMIEKLESKLLTIDKVLGIAEEQKKERSKVESTLSEIQFNIRYTERDIKDQERSCTLIQKEASESMVKTNDNREELRDTIVGLKSELDTQKIRKNKLAIVLSSLKDTGVKSLIIKEYIPVINKHINQYLEAMNFMVSFELSETFEETIKSRFRDEFSYASFSEGEKQRISLAITLAFRDVAKLRNSVASNLLCMDEIMDSSLDSDGIDCFMMIIEKYLTKSNLFVISHNVDGIQDHFDRTLSFKKVKNFSQMEEVS